MQTHLSFRDMEPSPAVEQRVHERAARLAALSDRITNCHVVIQAPHRHHHKGVLFDVRINIHVPGGEVVVNREGSQDHSHEDVYVVIRDAFDVAERRLEEWLRRHQNHR